jgi:hypothetical protein
MGAESWQQTRQGTWMGAGILSNSNLLSDAEWHRKCINELLLA